MNMVIPVTVVDNFFEDPMAVRQYALEQEYSLDHTNAFPGTRTKWMHELNYDLFEIVNFKFLNIFFPDRSFTFICDCFFQLVPSHYQSGWIHRDTNNLVSGIIYLNPNPDPDSGTTIYKQKTPWTRIKNIKEKELAYSQQTNDPVSMEENNSQFRESIIVKNEFNRLIAFDGHLPHSANQFKSNTPEEPRLTMVFFIYSIHSKIPYPMIRMRNT